MYQVLYYCCMYYYTVLYSVLSYRTQLHYCTVLYRCCTVLLLYTVPFCTIIQQPTLRCFHQHKLRLLALPACPFSNCVTPGISHHPHPEGEPCIIYQGRTLPVTVIRKLLGLGVSNTIFPVVKNYRSILQQKRLQMFGNTPVFTYCEIKRAQHRSNYSIYQATAESSNHTMFTANFELSGTAHAEFNCAGEASPMFMKAPHLVGDPSPRQTSCGRNSDCVMTSQRSAFVWGSDRP